MPKFEITPSPPLGANFKNKFYICVQNAPKRKSIIEMIHKFASKNIVKLDFLLQKVPKLENCTSLKECFKSFTVSTSLIMALPVVENLF